MHKRMMFLATAAPLGAAISRIHWLPSTMPASPLSILAFSMLTIAPMFIWDVVRNRRVHEAYTIWLAVYLPVSALVLIAWDKPWWHATAKQIMGVG